MRWRSGVVAVRRALIINGVYSDSAHRRLAGVAARRAAISRQSLPPAYLLHCNGVTRASERTSLSSFEVQAEPQPKGIWANALNAAKRTAPRLRPGRYSLRAVDEDYALALAETRPTTQSQILDSYDRRDASAFTESHLPLVDRLSSTITVNNAVSASLSVDQPIYTGGRVSADREEAGYSITAGRAAFRTARGDLFLQVVTANADVRRDGRAIALRTANLKQLEATLVEIVARREAGELTRTDIAQSVNDEIFPGATARRHYSSQRSNHPRRTHSQNGAGMPVLRASARK